MSPKVPPAGKSIPISTLENDASLRALSPADAALARRADVLMGDGNGLVTDAEMNAFITQHLPVVTEAMARKGLVPEARALLARAIAVQLKVGEAEENALLAAAIDGRATDAHGKRVGNGDGQISRAEVSAFIRDREARVAADPSKADEYGPQVELARRVLQRLAKPSGWGAKK